MGSRLAQAGEARLTISLVNEPLRLDQGQTMEMAFGLLPTPTRPLRKGTRDLRFGVDRPSGGENMVVLWPNGSWEKYEGYPEEASAAGISKALKGLANFKNILAYMGPGWAEQAVPQVTYFKSKWSLPTPTLTTSTICLPAFSLPIVQ